MYTQTHTHTHTHTHTQHTRTCVFMNTQHTQSIDLAVCFHKYVNTNYEYTTHTNAHISAAYT